MLYRPPRTTITEEMKEAIREHMGTEKTRILMGDLNMNLKASRVDTPQLNTLLRDELRLKQQVHMTTRRKRQADRLAAGPRVDRLEMQGITN